MHQLDHSGHRTSVADQRSWTNLSTKSLSQFPNKSRFRRGISKFQHDFDIGITKFPNPNFLQLFCRRPTLIRKIVSWLGSPWREQTNSTPCCLISSSVCTHARRKYTFTHDEDNSKSTVEQRRQQPP